MHTYNLIDWSVDSDVPGRRHWLKTGKKTAQFLDLPPKVDHCFWTFIVLKYDLVINGLMLS